MKLQLTETHRLVSDKHCYKLQKQTISKKTGKATWKAYRYYGSLASVFKNVPEQLLRESDANGLPEILKTLRATEHQLLTHLGEKAA